MKTEALSKLLDWRLILPVLVLGGVLHALDAHALTISVVNSDRAAIAGCR